MSALARLSLQSARLFSSSRRISPCTSLCSTSSSSSLLPALPLSKSCARVRVLSSFTSPSFSSSPAFSSDSSSSSPPPPAADSGVYGEDAPTPSTSGAAVPTGSTDNIWETNLIPDNEDRRTTHYLISGASRFVYASAARLAVIRVLATLSASADVLAMGTLEIPLNNIASGTTFTAKWRGKPVFIRHRTATEIQQARDDDKASLKDPQTDETRIQQPEWLVVLGVCTHLGCVPIANAGEYNGWFCPCHGSHYDTSGRIRKGPAPLNLEVPTYKFLSSDRILLG